MTRRDWAGTVLVADDRLAAVPLQGLWAST